MRFTSLIAKGEVRQAGRDLWAHAFNVDFRGRNARLGLTSLPDADREQGKAQNKGPSSTAEQTAHDGRSFPVSDNTYRPAIYSRQDCLCGVYGERSLQAGIRTVAQDRPIRRRYGPTGL